MFCYYFPVIESITPLIALTNTPLCIQLLFSVAPGCKPLSNHTVVMMATKDDATSVDKTRRECTSLERSLDDAVSRYSQMSEKLNSVGNAVGKADTKEVDIELERSVDY